MAAVNATQTLTFSGNAVANETVVVGGVTYTWKASVTTTANEVLVGGTAAASAQNLYDAINLTGTPGTQYGSLTVKNPQVRARAVTATTVVMQSRTPGVVGNLIASTETMTNGAFGAATLTGGTGSIDDEILDLLNNHQLTAHAAQFLRELAADPAAV